MKLVRYNPFHNGTSHVVSSMFDRLMQDSLEQMSRSFHPAVDIAEDEQGYDIQLSVAGAKKENFKIELTEGKLTIAGERKQEEKKEGKNYLAVESQFGAFSRSFFLPNDAEQEGIRASYEDGILKVHVPKAEKKTVKSKIEVE